LAAQHIFNFLYQLNDLYSCLTGVIYFYYSS
jgi:hypothetical protein